MSVFVKQGARLRAGRYELDRLLGAGGAAAVWLAQDTLLDRPVAIKLLSEGLAADRDWLARFRREARIAARLQHPNLVSIYDFEAEADRPFLVMAYMAGGSLANRLEHGGCPDAERLARDVLSALEHIHAAGIIHRDVKPANVLLDRDGRACLTDFGIARPEDATSITQTGQIPGTARYMAPELWRGEPATERSDLFAFGVLLSQCVGDESEAGSGADRVSPQLARLVQRLAAEDPELRPESATAALAMLDRRAPGLPGAIAAPDAGAAPDEPSFDEAPTPATHALAAEPSVEPQQTHQPPRSLEYAQRPAGAPKRWPAIAGLALVVVAAGAALASSLGGDDPTPAERAATRAESGGEQRAAGGADGSGDAAESTPAAAAPEPSSSPSVFEAIALNDEGFDLIGQGRYDEAIPILEQSVAGLEGSGRIEYAYALFNLGKALRLAGRPDEAIPILEKRLTIPNQTEVVAAELAQAREDAGLVPAEDKPSKPEKPEKPEKD